MIPHFEYDGKDSRDFGIYIVSKNVWDKSERNLTFVSVPGRDGDIIIDNGNYSNFRMTLNLRMFAEKLSSIVRDDFGYCLKKAANWLSQKNEYLKYTDSYEPDYYRKACICSGIRINQRTKDIADITITMQCKPFKYRFDGDAVMETTGKTLHIENPEEYTSKPYFKITPTDGATEFRLSVNGNVYAFYRADGYVEIDSEEMNVFKGQVNKNNDFQGDSFPVFVPGDNVVIPVYNVAKMEIVPRWRTL